MTQGPLSSNVAVSSGARKPLNVDANGNLLVSVPGGTTIIGDTYYTAAASGNVALGGNGTIGDVLDNVVITPATAAAGNVSVMDGNTTIPIYVPGGNLTVITPVTVQIGAKSKTGGWRLVTGANVTAIATGRFTA